MLNEKKRAFFYKESVVFPAVQLKPRKGDFELSDDELLVIIKYIDVKCYILIWTKAKLKLVVLFLCTFLSVLLSCDKLFSFLIPIIPATIISDPIF